MARLLYRAVNRVHGFSGVRTGIEYERKSRQHDNNVVLIRACGDRKSKNVLSPVCSVDAQTCSIVKGEGTVWNAINGELFWGGGGRRNKI